MDPLYYRDSFFNFFIAQFDFTCLYLDLSQIVVFREANERCDDLGIPSISNAIEPIWVEIHPTLDLTRIQLDFAMLHYTTTYTGPH